MSTIKLSIEYIVENMVAEARENKNNDILDYYLRRKVIQTTTAPSVAPVDLDSYLVIATAIGDFTGKEDNIATWIDSKAAWIFMAPVGGMVIWDEFCFWL